MKKYILVALTALCVQANAFFTLDFNAYNPTNITAATPLTIMVPGYGNVTFAATGVDVFQVNTVFGPGASLQLPMNRTIVISFDGPYAPTNLLEDISFGFNGLGAAETFDVVAIDSRTVTLTIINSPVSGTRNGAGLANVTFAAIPEPSTTALGALGVLALALRRRRAC
jgi:hypothetical protein